MKISLYAVLILILIMAVPIQEDLQKSKEVLAHCIEIIEKYQLKVKKYEELKHLYAAKILEHDRNVDKRKMMLIHVKLTWYLKQLATEEKYCNVDDDAQLEIDIGEQE